MAGRIRRLGYAVKQRSWFPSINKCNNSNSFKIIILIKIVFNTNINYYELKYSIITDVNVQHMCHIINESSKWKRGMEIPMEVNFRDQKVCF